MKSRSCADGRQRDSSRRADEASAHVRLSSDPPEQGDLAGQHDQDQDQPDDLAGHGRLYRPGD